MSLSCGCAPKWLTEISEPISVGKALSIPCPCCDAPAGKRCAGGVAGFTRPPRGFTGAFGPDRLGYADVCPARLDALQAPAQLDLDLGALA